MTMTETQLKSKLTQTLRKSLNNAVIFRHEDQFTSGIPDISVTWEGYTTWLEVKLAKPTIRSKGIQKHTMQMLSENGRCRYVVYLLEKASCQSKHFSLQSTYIVSPKSVNDWVSSKNYAVGFDHQFVVDFIKNSHSHP